MNTLPNCLAGGQLPGPRDARIVMDVLLLKPGLYARVLTMHAVMRYVLVSHYDSTHAQNCRKGLLMLSPLPPIK